MLAHVLLLGVPRRQQHVVAPDKVATDDGKCDGTVAYLFLAKDGLPLSDVWAEYFAGCEAGSEAWVRPASDIKRTRAGV